MVRLLAKLMYFYQKVLHGECPECHVLLVEQKGWARADCPMCKNHFYSF